VTERLKQDLVLVGSAAEIDLGRDLPAATLGRRKRAFLVPLRQWLAGELRELLHDTLTSGAARARGLFRAEIALPTGAPTGVYKADILLFQDGKPVSTRSRTLTVEKVGIDDACAFLCRFGNGSLGLFESTRYARGHKALYTLEINGEHASAFWDLHDLHRVQVFDHRDEGQLRGWKNVHVTDGDHPYMKRWWVPGLQIGYEHTFTHQFADFLDALGTGTAAEPTFRSGLATDLVTDAVLRSARSRRWESIGP